MIIERAQIITNRKLAKDIWKMKFDTPNIAKDVKGAGQFIEILTTDHWQHPLRRPMSIASFGEGVVSIIYKLFGESTLRLSQKRPGDFLELLGPLGNTFSEWNNDSYPILIGGGVGLAPILNLKYACDHHNIEHTMIIGAKNVEEHFIRNEPNNQIFLTTDDGSIGEKGTVMGPLERIALSNTNVTIYACGPTAMLKVIKSFALDHNIQAQLSVESYMGCGVGLCQGCAIHRKNSTINERSYHEKYSLVCVDGPVYDAREIYFG